MISYWPLTTYPVTLLQGERQQAGLRLWNEGVVKGEYWEITDPSAPVTVQKAPLYEEDSLGCLDHSPLRYGDLNDDGQAELVVIRDDRFSISSPAQAKEIFAAVWNHRDEAEPRLQQEIPQEDGYMHFAYEELGDQAPQSIAGSGTDHHILQVYPAQRAYAKFYFGDFDENDAADIVMWRKVYESNTIANEAEGFHLKVENWFHYEQVEGVYELKQTQAPTVQGWLAGRELRWPDGFPDISECDGSDGQLIPAMHDPLLNDPDVLK